MSDLKLRVSVVVRGRSLELNAEDQQLITDILTRDIALALRASVDRVQVDVDEVSQHHQPAGTWRADGRTIQFDATQPQGSPYVGAPVLANEQGFLERCAPDHPARIGWVVQIESDLLCVVMLGSS